jgi:hypothetical protein
MHPREVHPREGERVGTQITRHNLRDHANTQHHMAFKQKQ